MYNLFFENFGIIQYSTIENFGISCTFPLIFGIFMITFAPDNSKRKMAERIFRRKIYEQMLKRVANISLIETVYDYGKNNR